MVGRNNRNTNRRRRPRTRKRMNRHNKDVVNGVLFKPPNNPRTVNPRPWNNYSIQSTAAHAETYILTVGTITDEVTKANGLKDANGAGIPIEIKIISCELYGVTGQTLSATFRNFSSSGNIEQYDQCLPARNQYARLGYRWPLADQSVPFNSDTQKTVQVLYIYGTGQTTDRVLVKVRLLWRAATSFPSRVLDVRVPTSVETQISRLCDLLSDRLIITS